MNNTEIMLYEQMNATPSNIPDGFRTKSKYGTNIKAREFVENVFEQMLE